jgi:hypothetical protein
MSLAATGHAGHVYPSTLSFMLPRTPGHQIYRQPNLKAHGEAEEVHTTWNTKEQLTTPEARN